MSFMLDSLMTRLPIQSYEKNLLTMMNESHSAPDHRAATAAAATAAAATLFALQNEVAAVHRCRILIKKSPRFLSKPGVGAL